MTGKGIRTAILALLFASPLLTQGANAQVNLSGGIANVAPIIVSVTLGSSSLTPTAGTTTGLSITVVASDANGYNDITGVTVGVLKPDGTTVQVAQTAATFSVGSALQATFAKTLSMNFYDAAALTTSTYKVKAVATDAAGATGDNLAALSTFNYAQLIAAHEPSTLDFGTLNPGDTSSATAVSVQNYGNVQIDTQVSGTALSLSSPSATIPVGDMTYSLSSGMTGSSTLSGSAATLSTFDLTSGASSTKNIYFQLAVPSGSSQYVPAGTYTGTVTVTPVAG